MENSSCSARLRGRRLDPRVHLSTESQPPRVQEIPPLYRGGQATGEPQRQDQGKNATQGARLTPSVGVGHVLLTLENYKVSATLGVEPQSTRSYFLVLDTGAGPNLIRKDTLPDKWLPLL